VSDHRSEHVACAAGGPVEMFLRLTRSGPEVAEASNQSAG
jgi:hypothetical protein